MKVFSGGGWAWIPATEAYGPEKHPANVARWGGGFAAGGDVGLALVSLLIVGAAKEGVLSSLLCGGGDV
jgi:predicted lipid-binding transport protein (Tim44 family)